jgi:hypothetical protein
MSHWRDQNIERSKEYQRQYYLSHKEQIEARNKAWRANNPERLEKYREAARLRARHERPQRIEYAKKYYADPRGRAVVLCNSAKRRARTRGVDFSLTPEWVAQKIAAGSCELTGLPFEMTGDAKSVAKSPWSPSLDRIDPSGPYTPENVQVVVWLYNLAKNNFAHENVMALAAALMKVDR